MNIKDSYVHNGVSVLKDIKIENSILKKILAGVDSNGNYLDWTTVLDLTTIKPTTAGTADKVGHKLTFTGGVTGDWDGSANKTVAIPTKASWNYDDVYVKLSGSTMTGALTTLSLTVTGAATFEQAINGSILGNAATASRLLNARNIAISGAVTGNANFDGSGNIEISTSVNHTHSYAGSSSAGGAATNVVVNSGNNSDSTYPLVWHSGNTLYSTSDIYCNPKTDVIYSKGLQSTGRIKASSSNNAIELIQNADCGIYFTTGGLWIHIVGSGSSMFMYNGAWDNTGNANYDKGIVITSNNNIGIGKTSPSYKLHVSSDIKSDGYIRSASGFVKNNSSNDYILLGGGNHKAISDFVQLTGTQTISGNKTFSSSVSIDDLTAGNLVVTGAASFALTINGNITSADKVNHSLTILLNSGTTEGTNKFTFNGSAAKSINITPSAIGAKATQSAVSDPTASGNGISYIATISLNAQGVITATKSTVRSASTSLSGVVTTGELSFAGNKTFTGNITIQGTTSVSKLITATTTSGTEFGLREQRTGGADVGFGVGSGNTNHGVYSYSHSKWLIYSSSSDTNAKVYVNGTEIPASVTLIKSTDIGTAASHAHSDYVTSIGKSGSTITWSRGGTAETALDFSTTFAPYNADGYLPLTGGTLTGAIIFDYNLTNGAKIKFKNNRVKSGEGGRSDNFLEIQNKAGTTYALFGHYGSSENDEYIFIGYNAYNGNNLRVCSDKIQFGSNTVYHTGNLSPMTTSHAANAITSDQITHWDSVYTWLTTTTSDTDTTINKWKELEAFLTSITETDTLSGLLANRVAKSGDTMTGALTTPGLTVTGAATFSLAINGSILGNAATASRLLNARTIWGQSFDGSSNVTGNLSSVGNISFSASGKNIGNLLYFDITNARIGINKSSPQYTLDVDGAIRGNGIYNSGYYYMPKSTGGYLACIDNGGNHPIFGYGYALNEYDSTFTGYNIHIVAGKTWTSRSKGIEINSSGNVGIASEASSDYRLYVNGSANITGTIYLNGTAVSLSGHTHSYLPLNGGIMSLGEGLKFHSDDNYFGTNADARIISLLDSNGTTCDGGLIIDERCTSDGTEYITELLRIRDNEFKWKGNIIYHAGNLPAYPVVTNYYWANVKIKSTSDSATSPTFNIVTASTGNITDATIGNLVVSGGASFALTINGSISGSANKVNHTLTFSNGDTFNGSADLSVTKSSIGLGNVENTKLSTWTGTNKITTVGTIGTGTWNGTTIGVGYGGTGKTSWTQYGIVYASATDTLSLISLPTWAASTTYWLKCVTNASKVPTYSLSTISKSDVGLGNVDNTADANKSVNYATSAGKATNDENGDNIASTYLKKSGGTITNPILGWLSKTPTTTGWYRAAITNSGTLSAIGFVFIKCAYNNMSPETYVFLISCHYHEAEITLISGRKLGNGTMIVSKVRLVTDHYLLYTWKYYFDIYFNYGDGTSNTSFSVSSIGDFEALKLEIIDSVGTNTYGGGERAVAYELNTTRGMIAPKFTGSLLGNATTATTASTANALDWNKLTSSSITKSISSGSWTGTGVSTPTTYGTYVVQVLSGDYYYSGIFSAGTTDDSTVEEIPLHSSAPSQTRLYLATKNKLFLISSAHSSATNVTFIITYQRLL